MIQPPVALAFHSIAGILQSAEPVSGDKLAIAQIPHIVYADWLMFAGASSSDAELLNSLVSMIHTYAFTPSTNTPISPIYDPTTGESSDLGTNRLELFVNIPCERTSS